MKANDHEPCQELLGSLSDYLDGELDARLCAELESHLSTCPDCRIVMDTLRKTILLVREAAPGTEGMPAPVRERLYRTLRLEDNLNS
jgi:anti-sigma factor RsiW